MQPIITFAHYPHIIDQPLSLLFSNYTILFQIDVEWRRICLVLLLFPNASISFGANESKNNIYTVTASIKRVIH